MSAVRATGLLVRGRHGYAGPLIVAVVFLASGLTIGTSSYAFGLFIEPLEEAFKWQRTAISASLSFMAVGSLAAPFFGRLLDRYGARPVMAVSLSMFGLSFLVRPFMTELWHWYALSFLQFVVFSSTATIPAGRLIGLWFPDSRGRVMGIALTGNNFGGLVMPVVVGLVLAAASWQAAFQVIAGISFFTAMLVVLFVQEPRDRTGAPGPGEQGEGPSGNALPGWTVREALRTRGFYAMTLGIMLGSFTFTAILPQVSAHLKSEGMSTTGAAVALSTLALFGMMGKFVFGYLAERITAGRAMMVSFGGQVIFLLLMVGYPDPPSIWAWVALFGFFMAAHSALVPLIIQENFGLRSFGSISGVVTMATVFPFAIGPLMAGASFDITGSYGPAFVAVSALFAIGISALTQVRGTGIEQFALSARSGTGRGAA